MHAFFCALPTSVECSLLCKLGLLGNQSHVHDCISVFPVAKRGFSTRNGADRRGFCNRLDGGCVSAFVQFIKSAPFKALLHVQMVNGPVHAMNL